MHFQESLAGKMVWLNDAMKRIPYGTKVRVKTSDLKEYVGVTGTIIDYNIGSSGDWPLVGVVFDQPVMVEGSLRYRDGFYCDGDSDDELELIK